MSDSDIDEFFAIPTERTPSTRAFSLVCSIEKHDKCDGYAPNESTTPCDCACHPTERTPSTRAGQRAKAATLTLSDAYFMDASSAARMSKAINDIDPLAIEAEARADALREVAAEPVPLTLDAGMRLISEAEDFTALALHRWRHPSYRMDERTCRCRRDAQEAAALLLGDVSAYEPPAALARPEPSAQEDPR